MTSLALESILRKVDFSEDSVNVDMNVEPTVEH